MPSCIVNKTLYHMKRTYFILASFNGNIAVTDFLLQGQKIFIICGPLLSSLVQGHLQR
jgi:hypothetical protein